MRNRRRNPLFTLVIVALLASNLYLGGELLRIKEKDAITQTDQEKPGVIANPDTNITRLVEQTQEKVVSVITSKQNKGIGSGSGVVYKNENGLLKIITNHHVIDGGDRFIVRFFSGEEVEASLVGSDIYTDLAVLELKTNSEVKPFVLGDSTQTKVGEFVIAIGSPLGVEFENSVTFGVISGVNRMVPVDLNGNGVSDWDMTVLQTDAAINPGNSGGALVNMSGELIGINSLKFSSNQVEGMGFSIPISEVLGVIEQLELSGSVVYPVIGISAVSISDLNPYQKANYQISDKITEGVYIAEVIKGGPSDDAGLKNQDVIVGFNDKEIKNFKDFRKQLYIQKVGDEVNLKVLRAGETIELKVILE